ncbi:MAG TPA: pirin family protein [Roseateles sp.]|uniref:pirin family protein n=1 Tax=Roseateles sp. TaxID=1971397 RepID=UPI002EDAE551
MSTVATSPLNQPREVERLVAGQPTSDGAGVKLNRVLTNNLQRRLDPFLMLDHFGTDNPDDYIAGFPDHPHRGFETITYMLNGRMRHRDSAGHEGLISDGGVQWMTAGRGVIHSETPEQNEGRMAGFQLWLNLPAKDKLREPWYRDIAGAEVPEFEQDGVKVRVIAGESHGVAGAVQREHTAPLYLDLSLAPGARFEQPLPAGFNAFVYVFEGGLKFESGCLVPPGRMAILANTPGSDGVRLQSGDQATRALLIAGQPLNEPIAQYGPFVMNTEAELVQAVRDFQAGRLA